MVLVLNLQERRNPCYFWAWSQVLLEDASSFFLCSCFRRSGFMFCVVCQVFVWFYSLIWYQNSYARQIRHLDCLISSFGRSNLLRLAMSSSYELHTWFTYSMLLLFLSTAGFWVSSATLRAFFQNVVFPLCLMSVSSYLLIQMARLNEGLAFFDAIVIVPMFQIAWTFFSICTGFIYFQEYQVLLPLLWVLRLLKRILIWNCFGHWILGLLKYS